MLHLLKLEWLKVKNYRTFWIFMALYVVGLFGINYIAYQFQLELEKKAPLRIFPYDFPKIWQTIGWVSSWLLYFPGMIMILVITNEFTYKTHRQNIVDGLTRGQFVTGKILGGIALALITTIVCTLNVLLFGIMSDNTISSSGSEFILYYFVQSLSYLFVALIIAVLVRRGALSIGIFFLYGLVFENLLGAILTYYKIGQAWYYFPLQATDELIPLPFGKDLLLRDVPAVPVLVTFALLYIVVFAFLSRRRFQTADL